MYRAVLRLLLVLGLAALLAMAAGFVVLPEAHGACGGVASAPCESQERSSGSCGRFSTENRPSESCERRIRPQERDKPRTPVSANEMRAGQEAGSLGSAMSGAPQARLMAQPLRI